jgi:hypothetical protein
VNTLLGELVVEGGELRGVRITVVILEERKTVVLFFSF